MTTMTRCPAAHNEDTRECVGAIDAVRVIDRAGGETDGCVLHGAVALASITDGRVHAGSEPGSAIATYELAQVLEPFSVRGGQARERAAELRDTYTDEPPPSPCTGLGCTECGSGCDRDYGDD